MSRLSVSPSTIAASSSCFVALFVAGLSAWGSLKQELLPDVDFPVITIVAPYPARARPTSPRRSPSRSSEPSRAGQPGPDAVDSANSIALVVAQFEFGTDVDAAQTEIEENIAALGLPDRSTTVQALNINASPVIIASVSATSEDGLDEAARIATEEIVPRLRPSAASQRST